MNNSNSTKNWEHGPGLKYSLHPNQLKKTDIYKSQRYGELETYRTELDILLKYKA